VTGNGLNTKQAIGTPGLRRRLTLIGPDGERLIKGEHYRVRETRVGKNRSVYSVELLDADLETKGKQAFGRFFQGAPTDNDKNQANGAYRLLLDNDTLVQKFRLKTKRLDRDERQDYLNRIEDGTATGRIESKLNGFRIQQDDGTNGADVLTGRRNQDDTLRGRKGSDLLNGVGDRFSGERIRKVSPEQIDTLIGGKGKDYFQLGDIAGSFYNRGGENDYAIVRDFGRGNDTLVLSRKPNKYRVRDNVSVGDETGVGLYYGSGRNQDLIALIQGDGANGLLSVSGRLTNNAPVTFL
jgi:hypothetical protein